MSQGRPTRTEKFQEFNNRIRALRVERAAALASGDGETIRKTWSAERKLRGRIAALPRAFDDRKPIKIAVGIRPMPQNRRIRYINR